MTRILAFAAGFPDWRVPAAEVAAAWGGRAGQGHAGVCAPDQDTLTLAWDAASAAVAAARLESDAIGGLWWGTSRPPFAEGPSHAYLASALGLRPSAEGALLAGSSHAGVEALVAAWDAVDAGAVSAALVVASDALVPGLGTSFETRCGAGAAAVVLARDGGTASLVRRVMQSRPVVDRYRGDGEDVTRDLYDARLFREDVFVPAVVEVAAAFADEGVASWSVPDPDGRMGATISRRAGVDDCSQSTSMYDLLGDTGAAAPLLGLRLSDPGRSALLAYGAGRATAVLVDVEGPVPSAWPFDGAVRTVTYAEVLRSRRQLVPSGETIEMGVPPGGAAFVRGNPEMLGLLGGRCVDCGTISTPPSIHPHCVGCGGPKLEPVALARHGTVHTYVVNQTMPAPFEAPLALAVLDLDDGARLMVQATSPEGVEIGAEVELVLRRYALERGVPVYGFKARPRARAAL